MPHRTAPPRIATHPSRGGGSFPAGYKSARSRNRAAHPARNSPVAARCRSSPTAVRFHHQWLAPDAARGGPPDWPTSGNKSAAPPASHIASVPDPAETPPANPPATPSAAQTPQSSPRAQQKPDASPPPHTPPQAAPPTTQAIRPPTSRPHNLTSDL